MPLFEEDPSHLSKTRLKADLVAHNVALPPAKSRKEVYVELHLKHIDQKNAADFSSDEEDQIIDVEDNDPEEAEMPDPSGLTDDDLKAALFEHGVKAGPIVASTRALYEKKLRMLLQSNGHDHVNGTEAGVLYSDSEEEAEEEEEEEENGKEEDKESGSEETREETAEQSELVQQEESNQRAHATRNKEPTSKWNSGNAIKSSAQSRSRCSKIRAGISKRSSVDQHSGLGSGVASESKSVKPNGYSSVSSQVFSITQMVEEMESLASLSPSTDTERRLNGSNVQDYRSQSSRSDMTTVDKYNMKNTTLYQTPSASPHNRALKLTQEPVKDNYKEMFPDTVTTPTGIYASRRRPIKGAAPRPIKYAHPDTPVSPTTLERREVERRLVPIHIQIVVFLVVACVLYLIYAFVQDDSFSSVTALLDSLNQVPESVEGPQVETRDTPQISREE